MNTVLEAPLIFCTLRFLRSRSRSESQSRRSTGDDKKERKNVVGDSDQTKNDDKDPETEGRSKEVVASDKNGRDESNRESRVENEPKDKEEKSGKHKSKPDTRCHCINKHLCASQLRMCDYNFLRNRT